MEYTAHQRRILSEMYTRFIIRDERNTQISTDAERTKQAYELPREALYDQEEAEKEAADWAFITESEQEQELLAESLNNI